MSTWRDLNEEAPEDYVELLYLIKEECKREAQSESELSDVEDDESGSSRPETPVAPTYSPLTSPEPEIERDERIENRERSRSPLWRNEPYECASAGVVIEIYGEDALPLRAAEDESEVLDAQVFLTPHAHSVFGSLVENDVVGSALPVRGRGSGRRNGRRGGQGVGRRWSKWGRERTRRNQWEVGDPLNEIWLTDEDVPAALVSMVTNVETCRELKMQARNKFNKNKSKGENESEDEDDNDFHDANDEARQFQWFPMDSFQGKEEVFRPKRTGTVRIHDSAYDAFRSYWDDDILDLIVSETNRYALLISSSCFQSEWYPTNNDEILCLFAFWMMLGIIKMPTVTSCFSTDPLLNTEIFKRIFTKKRYEQLTRALNFIDADPACSPFITRSARDRLHILRPILLHLNAKFQSNYILDKDICIDESLTLWKGRLDFKQYIRTKASRFGIKTFELCESATGYLWSFIVYTGKQTSADLDQAAGVLKSTSIVKNLMAPLLNKGYRLFMDNWYNSPLLARFLKRNGTDCVGTLRPTRRDVPVLVNMAPLKRGDIIARHSGDVTVISWQDKKRITMISTCHGSSTALPRVTSRNMSRPVPYKPQVVLDYNKSMGGVDLKDQMLEPYLLERKRCNKWYMKLFKRLLNVSILNSRILMQSSVKKSLDHLAFRLQLVDTILTKHLPNCPQSRRNAAFSNRMQRQVPSRMVPGVHWPILLQQSAGSSVQNRNYRKHCVICLREGRKSIRTTYCCESCLVPLCVVNCFKAYHMSST